MSTTVEKVNPHKRKGRIYTWMQTSYQAVRGPGGVYAPSMSLVRRGHGCCPYTARKLLHSPGPTEHGRCGRVTWVKEGLSSQSKSAAVYAPVTWSHGGCGFYGFSIKCIRRAWVYLVSTYSQLSHRSVTVLHPLYSHNDISEQL